MANTSGGTGLLKGWVAIFLAIAVMALYGWLMDFPDSRDGEEMLPPEPAGEQKLVSESKQPPPATEPLDQPVDTENEVNQIPEEAPEKEAVSQPPEVDTIPEEDPLTTPIPGQPEDPVAASEPITTFQTAVEPLAEPAVEQPGDQIPLPIPQANRCALFQAGEIVDWGPPEQGNGIVIRARGVEELQAAATGKIVKLHRGPIRGQTLFQITQDGRYRLEYGHLGSLSPALKEGDTLTCGDVFATLSPASGSDIVKLHFAVYKIEPDQDWWAATETLDPEVFLDLQPDEL